MNGSVLTGVCCSALLAFSLAGCSKDVPKPPRPPDTAAVSNAMAAIASVFSPDGDCRRLDVKDLTVAGFFKSIEHMSPKATLWMPGEHDWLVIGTKHGHTNSLASAMERFSLLDTRLAFPQIFCTYVGTIGETLPAIASLDMNAVVMPQNFVTREIPKLGWLSTDDVDADIRDATLQEMRSMQVVRRIVLEGNMLAQAAKDRKGEEAATDKWALAAKRNPDDTFLAERMERLERNARGFMELRKVLQAMKCYETMILIRPTAKGVHNFGVCLKRIGKLDLAEKALARAKELERAETAER